MRGLLRRSRIAPVLLLTWVSFCSWILWGWLSVRSIQEPAFTLAGQREGYDIRTYEPQLVAQVSEDGSWTDAHERGRDVLGAYLGGDNTTQESVAQMRSDRTQPEGREVAAAAPLLSSAKNNAWLVSSVLPRQWSLVTLPRPNDPRIRIAQVPARTVAVLRFSGSFTVQRAAEHERRLRELLAGDKAVILGPAVFAQYYPSSVPPFLRRNEILIPIRP